MALGAIASSAAAALRPSVPALPALPALPDAGASAAAGAAGRPSFAQMVSNAIGSLEATQAKADGLAVQAATGQIGWTGGTGAIPPGAVPLGDGVGGAAAANGTQSFGQSLSHALDSLNGAQAKADNLAVQAATGDLTNVHDYMIASTEASLATQLTVAVRNKAVDAFNQIMNMGV